MCVGVRACVCAVLRSRPPQKVKHFLQGGPCSNQVKPTPKGGKWWVSFKRKQLQKVGRFIWSERKVGPKFGFPFKQTPKGGHQLQKNTRHPPGAKRRAQEVDQEHNSLHRRRLGTGFVGYGNGSKHGTRWKMENMFFVFIC